MEKSMSKSQAMRKMLRIFLAAVFAISLIPGITLIANATEVDDPDVVTTDVDTLELDLVEDAESPVDDATADTDPATELVPLAAASGPIALNPLANAVPSPTVPFATYTLSADEIKSWQVPLSFLSVSEKMDIMYVVDTTGSMSGIRTLVADTVSGFTSDLMTAGAVDINFGTAFFGDIDTDKPWFGITLPLGDYDLTTVSNALKSLTMTNGGDDPEDALMAYMQAVNDTAWRPDAQHVVVLITDELTKYRPTVTIGGYPVTLDGALGITGDNNIEPVIASYQNSRTSPLGDLATTLGVTEYVWTNATELLNSLVTAVILPQNTQLDYLCEAKVESIKYASDGVLSTDVGVSIAPASFVLKGGETNQFDLMATVSNVPARYNDQTIVEIGFYVDGIRIDRATQYLYFNTGAGPVPVTTTLPATGDSGTALLLVALQVLLLGLFSISFRRGRQEKQTA